MCAEGWSVRGAVYLSFVVAHLAIVCPPGSDMIIASVLIMPCFSLVNNSVYPLTLLHVLLTGQMYQFILSTRTLFIVMLL